MTPSPSFSRSARRIESIPVKNDERTPIPLIIGKGWFPDQLGGLNRYLHDMVLALERDGCPTHVVVVGPARDAPSFVTAVSAHSEPLWTRIVKVARSCLNPPSSAVIDAHFALYAFVPFRLGALRHNPKVVTFHGPWADEARSAHEATAVAVCLRRLLERSVYQRADRLIVLSSAFKRVLVEQYRVQPWRVDVVAPGVDLDHFHPGDQSAARKRLGVADDDFVAVAVRRLVPRMGLSDLLRAWSQLPNARPSTLLIAGDGPERETLEELALQLGCHSRVRFLGSVDDATVRTLYQAGDVNVVPSTELEGFGLTTIEAAACGTPTIVTDVGGLPEAMEPLDESLVVAPGDPDALGLRLSGALDARAGSLPSRERTRKFAEGFSWEAHTRRRRKIFDEVLRDEQRLLRVVYLDHVARLSGGELALLRLLPYLDGVDAHVILAEPGPLLGKLARAGISSEVLPFGTAGRDLRKADAALNLNALRALPTTAYYTARLARRLRHLQPDLVHANSLKAGVYGTLAARAVGVPVIWHMRDRISEDYLPRAAVRVVRAMAQRLPDAVIANSMDTLSTLRIGERPSMVLHSVVPEGVSGRAQRRDTSDRTFTVAVVGRFAPWKGQDFFLRAFAKAFPQDDAHAVFVGTAMFGEEGYEEDVAALSRHLGLEGRVTFRGFRNDVFDELSRVDLLVHCSVIPEPFGQVVVEGLAAGVPVVVPDVGGPAEIVEHGLSGWHYRIGDEESLAAALRTLKADQPLRDCLAAGGQKRARDFSPTRVAQLLQETYARVVHSAQE
jgi:glycosyltransferase involved in cell wall biosynthesis